MIWIVLAILVAGYFIAASIMSNANRNQPAPAKKERSITEKNQALETYIEQLKEKLRKAYLEQIEKREKTIKHEWDKDYVARKKKELEDFDDFYLLNVKLAEKLRHDSDKLYKQQTDYMRVLEYYEYCEQMKESADGYLEFGVDPPEIDKAESARAEVLIKRINTRAKEYGLFSKGSPEPIQ